MYPFLFYKQTKQKSIFVKNFYNLPNIYIYLNFKKVTHFIIESYLNQFNSFLFHNKFSFIFHSLGLKNIKFFFYSNSFLIHDVKRKTLTFSNLKILFEKKQENLRSYCLICFPIFCNIITNFNIVEFLDIFFFRIDKWVFLLRNFFFFYLLSINVFQKFNI